MLVDGGMRASYTEHVAPTLGELREQGKNLDVVCVSHIDRDHVYGILQMMEDLVAWRVHDYQVNHGNARHREPRSKRPPEVSRIWHNAFHEIVGENSGQIGDMLAATATILYGSESEKIRERAESQHELTASVGDAIELSHRIGGEQLRIPLNPEYDNKLMLVKKPQPRLAIGEMSATVLGPSKADLRKLRDEWNEWLEDNERELRRIRDRVREVEAQLAGDEIARVIQPALVQTEELGRRERVTTPNLASLMLLVEEDEKSILLTGDGHHLDILKGLKHHRKLDRHGRIHVDVLKVQHHGSEHNIDEAFCDAVTADHYIFCGNGAHHNPDARVVKLIVESRRDDDRPFKLWFNSSSEVPGHAKNTAHMRKIEALAQTLADDLAGRLGYSFLKESKFELTI